MGTQAMRQEPVAWPCEIEEADFEKDTITLKMLTSQYFVRAGKHWLSTTQPAAPVQPEQEPVAWGLMDDHGEVYDCVSPRAHEKYGGRYTVPLYTTPPAQPAQRQPLTDEQRRKLMSEAWNKWLSRKDDGRLFAWDFSFEVEAAHGITGEPT
jgi:hypothetical protein